MSDIQEAGMVALWQERTASDFWRQILQPSKPLAVFLDVGHFDGMVTGWFLVDLLTEEDLTTLRADLQKALRNRRVHWWDLAARMDKWLSGR